MSMHNLNARRLTVLTLLLALVVGVPLSAASDSGTATLDVTVDPTVSCLVSWSENGTSSLNLGNISAGSPPIGGLLNLLCAHNLGTGGFAVAVDTTPVTGGTWDSTVEIAGSGGVATLDPNTVDSDALGTYTSAPDSLSETFSVGTVVTPTQDPGNYQFTFTLTATSL